MILRINSIEDLSKIGVYKLTNICNNKFYIGSTGVSFKVRWKTHEKKLRKGNHSNSYLQNAYNKYSSSSFQFEILNITSTIEEALYLEQELLDKYKCYEREIGYNIETNVFKKIHTQNTKLLISNTLKEGYKSGRIIHIGNKSGVAWNKGKKCNNISNTRRTLFGTIEVYNSNKVHIATFRSMVDMCEWSITNNIPDLIITSANKKGGLLRNDKVHISMKTGKAYKGLYFIKGKPPSPEMGMVKWMNSGKS